MGAKPPPKMGGLGCEAPQLGINSFCDRLLCFFVVFPAFHNLFTPPKTPFFSTGPVYIVRGLNGL